MLLPNLIGSVILSKKLSLCLEKVFIDYNKITTNDDKLFYDNNLLPSSLPINLYNKPYVKYVIFKYKKTVTKHNLFIFIFNRGIKSGGNYFHFHLKIFENYSKDEIYDHRKAKFLQIGRDKGFSKSTNINDTGLTYKESGVIKLRSHFFKYKYIYVALGFVTLIGLIYTLF